jgi:hypothetical protein
MMVTKLFGGISAAGLIVILLLGFAAVCLLSRMSSDKSAHGQFGTSVVRTTATRLVRDAEVARIAAQQDSMLVLTLLHACESRILAQTAKRLCDSQDLKDLGQHALEVAVSAQTLEDDALQRMADLLESP